MKKRAISLVMMVMLLFASSVPAFASETTAQSPDSGQQILWVNTDDVELYLTFSGNRAECTAIVDGKTGTSKITANALLKRVNSNGTTTIKAWTDLSTTDASFYFDQPYYVASGYTYEFEIDAAVYRNGTVENIKTSVRNYCG